MASPRIYPRELLRLRLSQLWRERSLLTLPLVNALLPGLVLRRGLRRSGAAEMIYLSSAARERFTLLGLPPGRLLLPQIEAASVLPPPPDGPFRVGYFGPPLATRGADLALEAFEEAVARGLEGRLQLLLRPDSGSTSIGRFLARVDRSPQRHRIDCRVGMLRPQMLRQELARCHAFLLPFRLTISEVPLVVIEAGLSGRPTIVLEAPGVDEVARQLGGIIAASPAALPDALLAAASRPPARPCDTRAWTDWGHAVEPLLDASAGGSPAIAWWRWPASTVVARHSCCRLCAAASMPPASPTVTCGPAFATTCPSRCWRSRD